jgi:hypothetical protein
MLLGTSSAARDARRPDSGREAGDFAVQCRPRAAGVMAGEVRAN